MDQTVDRPVGQMHYLRNRIAHHEPLLRRDNTTTVLSLTTQQLAADSEIYLQPSS